MYVRTDMKSGAACYTVQRGDTLTNIAQRFYGAGTTDSVQKIYYSNLNTVGPNMNVIYPGQKLYIPD